MRNVWFAEGPFIHTFMNLLGRIISEHSHNLLLLVCEKYKQVHQLTKKRDKEPNKQKPHNYTHCKL